MRCRQAIRAVVTHLTNRLKRTSANRSEISEDRDDVFEIDYGRLVTGERRRFRVQCCTNVIGTIADRHSVSEFWIRNGAKNPSVLRRTISVHGESWCNRSGVGTRFSCSGVISSFFFFNPHSFVQTTTLPNIFTTTKITYTGLPT